MMRCCGAPAEWSGQMDLFFRNCSRSKSSGEPRKTKDDFGLFHLHQTFKKYLPEIELVSLWEVYLEYGLPKVDDMQRPFIVAVHDACTSRMRDIYMGLLEK
ncbi:hypothetical protein N752_28930 [Desulforamulus aquiferis]|nr:hypothetical protein [Desulforamulus aquiferis]RYD01603.1 hypothetical protein N752_28930 [Desulforamulus aquiferis]